MVSRSSCRAREAASGGVAVVETSARDFSGVLGNQELRGLRPNAARL